MDVLNVLNVVLNILNIILNTVNLVICTILTTISTTSTIATIAISYDQMLAIRATFPSFATVAILSNARAAQRF